MTDRSEPSSIRSSAGYDTLTSVGVHPQWPTRKPAESQATTITPIFGVQKKYHRTFRHFGLAERCPAACDYAVVGADRTKRTKATEKVDNTSDCNE